MDTYLKKRKWHGSAASSSSAGAGAAAGPGGVCVSETGAAAIAVADMQEALGADFAAQYAAEKKKNSNLEGEADAARSALAAINQKKEALEEEQRVAYH